MQLTPAAYSTLHRLLRNWIDAARQAGLDDDGIGDLFAAAMRELGNAEIA